MLKRIIVVMLAITDAIALTACNTDNNEVDETQKEKLDIQIEVSEM